MSGSAYTRWYRVGSVSVTQGSRVVTGKDTYWLDAGLNPGDIFMTDLQTSYEVDTITDSTHLTLKEAYQGATAANREYKIIRNFTATLPADIAAKTAQLLGDFRRYVDTDMQSIQGKSAYEIACDHGFAGTESQWLESLLAGGEITRLDGDLAALDAKHIARTSLLCANNAPQHNAVWGGRNIGSALTAEQSTEIRAGRFTDIYVGDYWDIPVPAYSWTDSDGTVHNESEGTIRFRVADCDYMIQTGSVNNLGLYTHHVAVVPDTALYTARMNAAATTAGGYIGSEMYKNNLKRAVAIFTAAFGSGHLLKYRELYSNAVDLDTEKISGEAWVENRVLDLMNEAMVRGDTFRTGQTYLDEFRKTQLAVFRMNPALCVCGSGTGRHGYWLNTPKNAAYFAAWSQVNRCVSYPASDDVGVRPCALVY